MQNQLQKVIDLAKKTGDRVIVFDGENPDNAYVIMPVEEYEGLISKKGAVNLTEDELIDTINRQIAAAQSEDEPNIFREESLYSGPAEGKKPEIEEGMREVSGFETVGNLLPKKKPNSWNIPPVRKKAAEEIIEEDRQYLEEINN